MNAAAPLDWCTRDRPRVGERCRLGSAVARPPRRAAARRPRRLYPGSSAQASPLPPPPPGSPGLESAPGCRGP